jgi:DNA-binding XRE family transcriptional regulator
MPASRQQSANSLASKVDMTLWDTIEPEPDSMPLGDGAIRHTTETRGRRSASFPQLNITDTAKQLGVTKAHLAKVLSGINRPSMKLAMDLANILGKELTFVASLYTMEKSRTRKPVKKIRKKKSK